MVCSRLLPAWLLRLDGNVTELLHRLDVENCAQTALDVLQAVFKGTAAEELLHNGVPLDHRYAPRRRARGRRAPSRPPLDERSLVVNRKLVPVESLSCENVLYWRALCEFIKAKGDDGEELLERVLPDAASYADYLYG